MNGARSGWRREAASVALATALAIGSIGCSSPFTDIVATNTEDVGPFEVVSASANDGGLTATVCIADAAHAEAVAAHVIEQRLNHGYASMTLHLIATRPDRPPIAKEVVWTRRDGVRAVTGAPTSEAGACTASATSPATMHLPRR